MPMTGMNELTRLGSRRVTIKPANRQAPAKNSAAQDGPDDDPLWWEANMSAPRIARATTSRDVARIIPSPKSRLGPTPSQYFPVMFVAPKLECAKPIPGDVVEC